MEISLTQTAVAFLAGIVGSAVNAVAGGGTLVTFPTLIWLGIPALEANATSALALWPGSASAAWGFRKDLEAVRGWVIRLSLPVLAGAAAGAGLLLETPPPIFEVMAPWLVLAGTVLFALDRPAREGAAPRKPRPAATVLAYLAIAVYGGYFGAGMGILMLASLGLAAVEDLHQRNALKNLFTVLIKGVAVVLFALSGKVVWTAALAMAAGAVAGGWAGAWLQYRLGRERTRRGIVALGVLMGLALLYRLGA